MSQAEGPDVAPGDAPTQAQQQGFGHSGKRVAAELGILASGVLLLIAGGIYLVANLADLAADSIPVSADVSLGESSWSQLAPAEKRCSNHEPERYVEALAKPLIARGDSPFTFRFTVVKDSTINAFALPGGFVTVNMGLLEAAESGEEIASVLAHEMAHVTLRHGTRRVVRQLGTGVLLSILFGGTDLESLGYGAGALVGAAYDRDQEAAADREGQRLLRQAGISPSAMARFFARLAEQSDGRPTLMSTHPDPGERSELAQAAARGFVPTTTLPPPPDLTCE